ncbi:hypothetical protein BDV18DRAFT_137195 [Aspergillus unguis]
MEMRSLTRCLRSRPTTTLLNRPNQFLSLSQRASFSSTPSTLEDNRNNRLQPKSSINDILDTLNLKTQLRPSAASRNRPQRTQQPGAVPESQRLSAADAAIDAALDRPGTHQRQNRPNLFADIKTGPQLGRYVPVQPERGVDLERALQKLGISLATNNVKQDMLAQKFHVRRGQKKKNLRMSRWRKLFKFSFTETVNKIQKMRRQGW